MSKYLIHCVPRRMWYVKEHLIPSMLKQGIYERDILVYNDSKGSGNLTAFVNSIKNLKEDTWHLQDDIIISSNFAHITENVKNGIVCGFCSGYSKDVPSGTVFVKDMWYSFPCIRIPVKFTKEFPQWLEQVKDTEPYSRWIKENKYDDSLFMEFLQQVYPGEKCLNLNPNIVDHIDYLIGGSNLNSKRHYTKAMSIYWREPELLTYWKKVLK